MEEKGLKVFFDLDNLKRITSETQLRQIDSCIVMRFVLSRGFNCGSEEKCNTCTFSRWRNDEINLGCSRYAGCFTCHNTSHILPTFGLPHRATHSSRKRHSNYSCDWYRECSSKTRRVIAHIIISCRIITTSASWLTMLANWVSALFLRSRYYYATPTNQHSCQLIVLM